MAFNVLMPQMGESVAEGTIVRWLKKVGDSVDRDEPIFEITTDKVDAEIPASEAGTLLEIRVQEGETVDVGAIVAVLGDANEQVTASTPAPAVVETPATLPTAAAGPSVDVIMPQMGESVAEGTIVRWLKAVGDVVDRDEPIFEITTDKVDAEIPALEGGTLLEIRVQEGETVEVGAVVARIGAPGAIGSSVSNASSAPAEASAPQASAPVQASQGTVASGSQGNAPSLNTPRSEMTAAQLRRVRSTPVVRKIAAEHGIDLQNVSGTGLDHRVTKRDIEAYIASGAAQRAQVSTPAQTAPVAPAAKPAASAPASAAPSVAASNVALGIPMNPVRMYDNDQWEPMSRMRKTISNRMVESKQYSAHVHTCFEIDYGKVNQLRKQYKKSYTDRGAKLTFTTFLAQATVKALRAFPIVNSAHDGENIIYRGDINLGIAVAVDWGLLVPVIHHADELSMLGLSKKIADLGERSRTKKLKPDEVQGLTFSITNPGVFGSQWGTPIIPQPSTAILGVGTIEKRVKVVTLPDGTDTFAVKLCGYLTLGFDHRVIDGAVADQFMTHLKNTLESFDESAL
jgi:2-oxoglutarate dehydrogenase E2 component (dihydrolipoamide succinyltransferase)